MSIYNYLSYKKFLKDLIAQQGGRRGFLKDLAQAGKFQPSQLSRVLNSKLHLMPDHVPGIAEFLNFSETEEEFFETLLHYERSGSKAYRARLLRRLTNLKEKSQDISRVFDSPELSSPQAQSFYYSSWLPSAIHIACAVEGLNSPQAISQRFAVSLHETLAVLERLKALGLVQEEKGILKITQKNLHISKDSFLTVSHHSNWRNVSIQNIQKRDFSSLHFSGVFAVGSAEFEKIKVQIRDLLESVKTTVRSSPKEQELIFIGADAFRVQ